MEGHKSSEVGETSHISKKEGRPEPGACLSNCHSKRRHALRGKHIEDHQRDCRWESKFPRVKLTLQKLS